MLVSVFVAIHITLMVTSGLPDRSAVGDAILRKLEFYQVFFGLDQTWSMFAPNPASVNSYLDAVITFTDGSTEKWTFPRSSRMSPWDRFTAGERVRKYQQENLMPMQRAGMWFDLSRFLEREVSKLEKEGKGRVVAQIQFYRHVSHVKPPSEVFVEHGKVTTEFQKEAVFNYIAKEKVRYEAKNNN